MSFADVIWYIAGGFSEYTGQLCRLEEIVDFVCFPCVAVAVWGKIANNVINGSLLDTLAISDAENSRSACFDWHNFIRTGIKYKILLHILLFGLT